MSDGTSSAGYPATLFDGRCAAGRPVSVQLNEQRLSAIAADGATLVDIDLNQIGAAESFRRGPRFLALPDGMTLEVDDGAAFSAAAGLTLARGLVGRLQASSRAAAAALLAVVALLVWGYRDGLPAAVQAIVFALPPEVETQVGANAMAVLDDEWLSESKLPEWRQRQILSRFNDALQANGIDDPIEVEFRAGSGPLSFNAFALPGGRVVLLDDLVMQVSDDLALAVLAHEAGHVVHRHGMRNVLQAGGVAAMATLVWGDLGLLAANAPVVLGTLRYSREFEREADEFAVAFLVRADIDPESLIRFFEVVRETRRDRDSRSDFLSTHPGDERRIAALQEHIARLRGAAAAPAR